MDLSQTAFLFHAFSDKSRLKLVELLTEGEKSASALLRDMDIVQSTLSHHMKILCDSGAVIARTEGKWTYYSLNSEGLSSLIHYLSDLANRADLSFDEEEEETWDKLVTYLD